jgi:hypothetical protein
MSATEAEIFVPETFPLKIVAVTEPTEFETF